MNEYSFRRLDQNDYPVVESLFQRSPDYFLMADGKVADRKMVIECFELLPDGDFNGEKVVEGFFDGDQLIALLDYLTGYPDGDCWWIGLLLIDPACRGKGAGRSILTDFFNRARAAGVKEVQLGVIRENINAFQFWSKIGFKVIRVTRPLKFGEKEHIVDVMSLQLN